MEVDRLLVTEPSYDPAKTVADLWIVAPDGGRNRGASRRHERQSPARRGHPIPDALRLRRSATATRSTRSTCWPWTAARRGASPRWRPARPIRSGGRDGTALLFESLLKPTGQRPTNRRRASSTRCRSASGTPGSMARSRTSSSRRSTADRRWTGWRARSSPPRPISTRPTSAPAPIARAAAAVVARRPGDRLRRHRQPHHDDARGRPSRTCFASGSGRRAGRDRRRRARASAEPAFSPDGRVLVAQSSRSPSATAPLQR